MRNRRQIAAVMLAAALASSGSALHAQSFDHSYAVVIGINDYQHSAKWPHLDYPEKDAKALADFLTGQGFAVKPFYGPAAKKQAILSYMQDTLAPRLTEHDRVLVFFAGHGHTENLGGRKRGYVVPYDGDASSTLISMDELQDESSYMGSARHQFFLLDSCFGGLLERPRDSVVDPGIPNYLQNVTNRIARQALTAGGENEQVVDNGPYGHSVFMDALLEALKDGMADLNGDGYITFNELAAFVVPKASNKYQTPAPGYLPGHELGEFWFRSPKGTQRAAASIPLPPTAKLRAGDTTKTAEQHVAAGDALWNAKDWDGAAAQYGEAIRLDPNDASSHRNLGIALGHKGDWDGAIKELSEAIRLDSNDAASHRELGTDLADKGDWDGDIKEEREAIRLNPNDAVTHRNLGIALGHKGDWDGAIKELSEAIRLDSNDAVSHRELGTDLANKGDWDGDIKEEREAIRLNPNDAVAHDRLGWALEHKGLLLLATAEYLVATNLDPYSQEYKDDLARVEKQLKQ